MNRGVGRETNEPSTSLQMRILTSDASRNAMTNTQLEILKLEFALLSDFARNPLLSNQAINDLMIKTGLEPAQITNWFRCTLEEQTNIALTAAMSMFKTVKVWTNPLIVQFSTEHGVNPRLTNYLIGALRDEELSFLRAHGMNIDMTKYNMLFGALTAKDFRIGMVKTMETLETRLSGPRTRYEHKRMRSIRMIAERRDLDEEPDFDYVLNIRMRVPNGLNCLGRWRHLVEMFMRTTEPTDNYITAVQVEMSKHLRQLGKEKILEWIQKRIELGVRIGATRKKRTPESEVRLEKAWLYFGEAIAGRLEDVAKWACVPFEEALVLVDEWNKKGLGFVMTRNGVKTVKEALEEYVSTIYPDAPEEETGMSCKQWNWCERQHIKVPCINQEEMAKRGLTFEMIRVWKNMKYDRSAPSSGTRQMRKALVFWDNDVPDCYIPQIAEWCQVPRDRCKAMFDDVREVIVGSENRRKDFDMIENSWINWGSSQNLQTQPDTASSRYELPRHPSASFQMGRKRHSINPQPPLKSPTTLLTGEPRPLVYEQFDFLNMVQRVLPHNLSVDPNSTLLEFHYQKYKVFELVQSYFENRRINCVSASVWWYARNKMNRENGIRAPAPHIVPDSIVRLEKAWLYYGEHLLYRPALMAIAEWACVGFDEALRMIQSWNREGLGLIKTCDGILPVKDVLNKVVGRIQIFYPTRNLKLEKVMFFWNGYPPNSYIPIISAWLSMDEKLLRKKLAEVSVHPLKNLEPASVVQSEYSKEVEGILEMCYPLDAKGKLLKELIGATGLTVTQVTKWMLMRKDYDQQEGIIDEHGNILISEDLKFELAFQFHNRDMPADWEMAALTKYIGKPEDQIREYFERRIDLIPKNPDPNFLIGKRRKETVLVKRFVKKTPIKETKEWRGFDLEGNDNGRDDEAHRKFDSQRDPDPVQLPSAKNLERLEAGMEIESSEQETEAIVTNRYVPVLADEVEPMTSSDAAERQQSEALMECEEDYDLGSRAEEHEALLQDKGTSDVNLSDDQEEEPNQVDDFAHLEEKHCAESKTNENGTAPMEETEDLSQRQNDNDEEGVFDDDQEFEDHELERGEMNVQDQFDIRNDSEKVLESTQEGPKISKEDIASWGHSRADAIDSSDVLEDSPEPAIAQNENCANACSSANGFVNSSAIDSASSSSEVIGDTMEQTDGVALRQQDLVVGPILDTPQDLPIRRMIGREDLVHTNEGDVSIEVALNKTINKIALWKNEDLGVEIGEKDWEWLEGQFARSGTRALSTSNLPKELIDKWIEKRINRDVSCEQNSIEAKVRKVAIFWNGFPPEAFFPIIAKWCEKTVTVDEFMNMLEPLTLHLLSGSIENGMDKMEKAYTYYNGRIPSCWEQSVLEKYTKKTRTEVRAYFKNFKNRNQDKQNRLPQEQQVHASPRQPQPQDFDHNCADSANARESHSRTDEVQDIAVPVTDNGSQEDNSEIADAPDGVEDDVQEAGHGSDASITDAQDPAAPVDGVNVPAETDAPVSNHLQSSSPNQDSRSGDDILSTFIVEWTASQDIDDPEERARIQKAFRDVASRYARKPVSNQHSKHPVAVPDLSEEAGTIGSADATEELPVEEEHGQESEKLAEETSNEMSRSEDINADQQEERNSRPSHPEASNLDSVFKTMEEGRSCMRRIIEETVVAEVLGDDSDPSSLNAVLANDRNSDTSTTASPDVPDVPRDDEEPALGEPLAKRQRTNEGDGEQVEEGSSSRRSRPRHREPVGQRRQNRGWRAPHHVEEELQGSSRKRPAPREEPESSRPTRAIANNNAPVGTRLRTRTAPPTATQPKRKCQKEQPTADQGEPALGTEEPKKQGRKRTLGRRSVAAPIVEEQEDEAEAPVEEQEEGPATGTRTEVQPSPVEEEAPPSGPVEEKELELEDDREVEPARHDEESNSSPADQVTPQVDALEVRPEVEVNEEMEGEPTVSNGSVLPEAQARAVSSNSGPSSSGPRQPQDAQIPEEEEPPFMKEVRETFETVKIWNVARQMDFCSRHEIPLKQLKAVLAELRGVHLKDQMDSGNVSNWADYMKKYGNDSFRPGPQPRVPRRKVPNVRRVPAKVPAVPAQGDGERMDQS